MALAGAPREPRADFDEAQARQSETRMIGNVEKLGAELSSGVLGNLHVLHQRKIQGHAVRASDSIAAQGSKESEGASRKGARIKPQIGSSQFSSSRGAAGTADRNSIDWIVAGSRHQVRALEAIGVSGG